MIKLLEHNQRPANEILSAFQNNTRSVLYTSGVGTGKSYVFMYTAEQLLQEDQRVLYVVPKHVIKNNIKAYSDFKALADKVDFCTYNTFTDKETGMALIEKYKLIVIDEAHRMYSDIYGECIQTCMKASENKHFLGLTATPVRKVKGKGMVSTEDLFDVTVDGITNFEAIKKGLMPKFNYRLMLPEQDLQQLKKEYENSVSFRLDYEDSETVMKKILKKYPRKKWIAFYPSKTKLEEGKAFIEEIFSDYEIFVLHSELDNLDEVMDGMRKAKKGIILSVNMLLEGVHMPDITGILIFRGVTSLVTFQQILGRVCSIGNKVEPLVVDGSSCGPKFLNKLLNFDKETNNTTIYSDSSISAKQIMKIGIGAEKEWEKIGEFLLFTGHGSSALRKENSKRVAKRYLSILEKTKGTKDELSIYDSLDEWMEDETSYKILISCNTFMDGDLETTVKLIGEIHE